ncbi:arsenate reductase (glutaredoxin) [Aureisphaera galaxeae]|uniref:arsenate reductase (glutaredoxin) n=1 Tax=Aureisphaera galaxeae TaxID=1538023 RepID=UPI002350F296|nr:arsenate reductase (glutaredoxin) [Aureisphaera galaxeae]MDC8003829.1 arsenate reductase (glutaredoxin) [Aureisphaera galaxeae]
MTKIYHNPRCRKSRETLQILEEKGETIDIVLYLENPLTREELSDIIKLLGIAPIDLVRKNEAIWKELYKGKELSDAQIISAMVENPKLIERPIVIKNGKAALGRPPESVLQIL